MLDSSKGYQLLRISAQVVGFFLCAVGRSKPFIGLLCVGMSSLLTLRLWRLVLYLSRACRSPCIWLLQLK